jgi:hypothetical protein
MKITAVSRAVLRPKAAARTVGQGWPGYLFGGRVRTSTAALLLAFIALFWVQQAFQPEPKPAAQPVQTVPPGFVPDPAYTWVPRTQVEEPTRTRRTTTTTTTTTSPTETTTTSPTTTSPTSPTSTTPLTTVVDPDGFGPLPPQTQTVTPVSPATPTVTAPLPGPPDAPAPVAPPR